MSLFVAVKSYARSKARSAQIFTTFKQDAKKSSVTNNNTALIIAPPESCVAGFAKLGPKSLRLMS
jgi:hypothetical protein